MPAVSLLLLLLLQTADPSPRVLIQSSTQDRRPVRIASAAFGERLEIEVRDLPRETSNAAIQAAMAEVVETERLLRPDAAEPAGGIGSLNATAGQGPHAVDPRLMELLVRTQEFCYWSEGAHGPLGRSLYELWGLRGPKPTMSAPPEPPDPQLVKAALDAANCGALKLRPAKNMAELAVGSRLDLGGFAEGHAVDLAVDVLRKQGVKNGFVQLGALQRAFGKGADGRGWKVVLPTFAGLDAPAGRFQLRDKAAAMISTLDGSLRIADQLFLPYLNQRTGLPAQGLVGVVTVTELAVDAQALAIAMALTGPREGELRLGSLRPNPSVLWFLGSGSGVPLQADHRWGEIIAGSR